MSHLPINQKKIQHSWPVVALHEKKKGRRKKKKKKEKKKQPSNTPIPLMSVWSCRGGSGLQSTNGTGICCTDKVRRGYSDGGVIPTVGCLLNRHAKFGNSSVVPQGRLILNLPCGITEELYTKL